MTKKKIFISFDANNERAMKNDIVALSQQDGAKFKIANWSLNPKNIDNKWQKETRYHLNRCDMLVVLTGEYTGSAPGVQMEIELAKSLGTKTVQILSHPQVKPLDGIKVITESDL